MPILRPAYTAVAVAVFAVLMLLVMAVTYLTVFVIGKTRHRHHKRFPRMTTLAKRIANIGALAFLGLAGFSISAMNYVNPFIMIFLVWIVWTWALVHYFRRGLYEKVEDIGDESAHLSPTGEIKKRKLSGKGLQNRIVQGCQTYYQSLRSGIQAKWKKILPLSILLLFGSAAIGLMSADLCFCQHPNEISTRFTRMFSPEACESRPVCHVYFTLPQDPSTSIIANFQSSREPSKGWIEYRQNGTTSYKTVATNFFKSSITEIDRYVHWADIFQLEPGTAYEFRFGFTGMDNQDYFSSSYLTRTIPSSGNVTFISGGDMQVDDFGESISAMSATHSPHFAVVAGDVSYANGFKECYRRWDKWFESWERAMKTPEGFVVPFTLAIGNHEAGGDFNRPRSDVPFYFEFFPQETGLVGVKPDDRPSFHHHRISNHTELLILDSGIVTPMLGAQLDWMNDQLSNSMNVSNRIVAYHYPLFPSVTRFDSVPDAEKLAWSSTFFNHKVTVAFENHFHVWKRSKPVTVSDGSVNDQDGIVYLGDGAVLLQWFP
eukprot:TRINITY_DN4397_c0_g1_i2.p1 TRINITY_DN4397_c0_g1~~TRINITY_DN4397_c0_g1_i2.p1  ORF type:complete len:545 (+),score=93.22 TRINITY_DN4397_c0_g1_i2:30-1664(+)